MALARQNKRETNIVEGVDLDEIDIAVAVAQQQSRASKGNGSANNNGNPKDDKPQGTNKVRRTLIVIAVVLASLIMALSILLPSLSAVIQALTSGSEAATTEAATTEAASDDTEVETEDSTASYIETIDERYSSMADSLKTKVEADATDKASIINLANTYYEWGTSVSNFASSDEQKEHVSELLQNALTYYDQYLALEDAKSARVNKAACEFYLGDANTAITELEAFCEQTTDYAPAWSNLGMMYNACGETQMALDAYNKALEVDPDDTYGLKSSVESQITSLSAATEEAAENEASDEATTAESE